MSKFVAGIRSRFRLLAVSASLVIIAGITAIVLGIMIFSDDIPLRWRLQIYQWSSLPEWSEYPKSEAELTEIFDVQTEQTLIQHLKQQLPDKPLKFYPLYSREQGSEQRAMTLIKRGYRLRDNPTYYYDKPFDWGIENNDSNWRFKINSLAQLIEVQRAYQSHRDRKWLDIHTQVILDWIDYNLVTEQRNDYAWYDMAAGLRAVQIAYLIDQLLRHDESPSGKTMQWLLISADIHAAVLEQEWLLSDGNHGAFQLIGLASICKVLPTLKRCRNLQIDPALKMQSLVNRQFTKEGIHTEHSTQYQLWMTRVFKQLDSLGLFDSKIFAPARNDNGKWFFFPDGRSTLFGDTGEFFLDDYAADSADLNCLSLKNCRLSPESPKFRVFPESGYAFYRSNWSSPETASYLAISASFHSFVHKQADDLTFSWFENGQAIITDSGKFSYDTNPESDYFRSTASHNVMQIDDLDYPTRNAYAFNSAIQQGALTDGLFWLKARVEREYWGLVQSRIWVLNPGRWLLVVDEIKSDEEHDYTRWLHFSPDFQARPDNGLVLVSASADSRVRVDDLGLQSTDVVSFRGNIKSPISGWLSKTYYDKIPRTTLGLKSTAKSGVWATLLRVGNSKPLEWKRLLPGDNHLDICWREQGDIHSVGIRIQHEQSNLLFDCSVSTDSEN